MKWTSLNELRDSYLKFFESKEHLRAKSFPLIPKNDNSLLLINAGMAPLKPYFTGQEVPPKTRMTTCQKCIRTGDIENVGITARHGTFFEMLGNFSFGDYFKEDAIKWAWEYVTTVLEIPADRLYVSVYEEDDEAEKIWHEQVGIPMDRIFRMGKEDNFWEAGIDGPCGPCSEIYFDRGEEYGCGKEGCTVGCDCDRYMEFWNLVFTQFERHEDGTYTPLKQRNIDTGMGLERLAAMMQNVNSIFDVDTIKAIRDKVCEIAGVNYGDSKKADISIRVITDHIRSVTFMASDGVLPSNEGRGYVMRRLLRRAVRHAKLLGIKGLFLNELVKTVVDNSKCEYNELEEKFDYISKLLTNEEKNFNETIDRGMNILEDYIEEMQKNGKKELDGNSCFVLSDTYGFPIDLTREILEEKGFTYDEEGFKSAVEEQKKRARDARGGSKYMGADETVFHQIDKSYQTEFVGYKTLECESKITYITTETDFMESASYGDEVYIITDTTPFYAESGGQVGDKGTITTESGTATVIDTQKVIGGKTAHKAQITNGVINNGQNATLKVDTIERLSTMRNHSCAHLLQAALREILGEHVHQAGQLVSADRLRFDFSHFEAMTTDEIKQVEAIVNNYILSAIEVIVREMPIKEAQKLGAMALFGEKYGEVVRVVSMGDASVEFCGGTHVSNTSNIGLFHIISESSVAAGVRRIEAVTGAGVLELLDENSKMINASANALKITNSNELATKCIAVMDEVKQLQADKKQLQEEIARLKADALYNNAVTIGSCQLIASVFKNTKADILRKMSDDVKANHPNMICVLIGTDGDKGNIAVSCGKEALTCGAHAGNIAKAVAAVADGRGGGKPDSAMAGISNVSKANDACKAALEIVTDMLSK